jgi:hypothetical protein
MGGKGTIGNKNKGRGKKGKRRLGKKDNKTIRTRGKYW